MKEFFKQRYVIFNLFFDIITICYVIFWNWNPARIIVFYWLDTCVMLFFFILFMKVIGRIKWYLEVFIGTAVLWLLNLAFYFLIFEISKIAGFEMDMHKNPEQLLFPYYDIGVIVLLSSISNLAVVKKLKSLHEKGAPSEIFFYFNCVYAMLLIPIVIFCSVFVQVFLRDPSFSIIVTFLIFRNRLDLWRFKKFKSMEIKIQDNL